jgi:hypothetical protein
LRGKHSTVHRLDDGLGFKYGETMKFGWTLPLLALILAAFACSWSDVAPPAAPEIEPSSLPTFAIPTLTPVPSSTPLPTPTSTPDTPVALPKSLGVNCRYGPGQEWETVSSIPSGKVVEIKGRTVDTSWWYVQDPMKADESFCWVAYDAVDTAGGLNSIPIVEPPQASVTDVRVDMVIATVTACGSSNQVTLSGTITTNGPQTVTYHWEVSGATQVTMPDATLEFDQSGKQSLTSTVSLTDCGEYTVTLRVTEPNAVFAQKSFALQNP